MWAEGKMAIQQSGDISRRTLLRVAGGVVLGAATVPLALACSPSSSPGSAAKSGRSGTSGSKVKLPSSVALPDLPKADLPGTPDGLLAPGYQRYPSNLIKSVPQPPGKGGEVNALPTSLRT